MDEKVIIQQKPPKSPAVAGILSAIVPGLGTLYDGLIAKGVVYMAIIGALIAIQDTSGGQPFKALMLAGFYFFQIIDAVNNAKAINLAAAGQKPEDQAKAALVPDLAPVGSIFWGSSLIVIGIVVILVNFDIITWRALGYLWPVPLIVFGLKLIYDSMAKAKNGK